MSKKSLENLTPFGVWLWFRLYNIIPHWRRQHPKHWYGYEKLMFHGFDIYSKSYAATELIWPHTKYVHMWKVSWFVFGKRVHQKRLLRNVGKWVPAQ